MVAIYLRDDLRMRQNVGSRASLGLAGFVLLEVALARTMRAFSETVAGGRSGGRTVVVEYTRVLGWRVHGRFP